MGKLVVSENATLDGVVEDPAGAEGFERGEWCDDGGRRAFEADHVAILVRECSQPQRAGQALGDRGLWSLVSAKRRSPAPSTTG